MLESFNYFIYVLSNFLFIYLLYLINEFNNNNPLVILITFITYILTTYVIVNNKSKCLFTSWNFKSFSNEETNTRSNIILTIKLTLIYLLIYSFIYLDLFIVIFIIYVFDFGVKLTFKKSIFEFIINKEIMLNK